MFSLVVISFTMLFKFQYDNTLSFGAEADFLAFLLFKFQYDNTLRYNKSDAKVKLKNLNSNMIIL